MDIVLRFWNNESNTLCTRYFGSAFMDHATAECLLASFKEVLTEVPLNKMLQVSMDGSTNSWKFMDLLTGCLEDNSEKLLEMGSCGLHVIHWNVNVKQQVLHRNSMKRRNVLQS